MSTLDAILARIEEIEERAKRDSRDARDLCEVHFGDGDELGEMARRLTGQVGGDGAPWFGCDIPALCAALREAVRVLAAADKSLHEGQLRSIGCDSVARHLGVPFEPHPV